MKKKHIIFTTLFLLPLLACQGRGQITINDYLVEVERPTPIDVTFSGKEADVTYQYSNDYIRIVNGQIRGLLSGTTTNVTATTNSGAKTTFKVEVKEDTYVAKSSFESSEGWLDPISYQIAPSLNNHTDFPLGMDISMTKQIYDMGGQFYNEDGQAESLYRLLYRHGVDYARFRLWHDPYNHVTNDDGSISHLPYGGGICDLDTILGMAKNAKAAGMRVLLDFHFSDFWADPSNQVIPKAWQDFQTSDQVATALRNYVKETLLAFQNINVLPDMVQLGNETTPGMLLNYPGPTNEQFTGQGPYYINQKSALPANIRGQSGSENFIKYIQAAAAGVDDVSGDILKMIHLARGLSNINGIKDYFHQFDYTNYDVIGLSGYSYYHFPGGISVLQNAMNQISQEFPHKKITLAETAYGFTYAGHSQASNIFSRSGNQALSGYQVSVQGQANLISDIIESVASIDNGYGVFYWEGAWIPIKGAGWADEKSKCSWANQSFFTYDGRALPSLALFQNVKN